MIVNKKKEIESSSKESKIDAVNSELDFLNKMLYMKITEFPLDNVSEDIIMTEVAKGEV